MVEAHFHQRGQRSVRGNMAADSVVVFIGPDDHRHGVPADIALDTPLELPVAWIGDFFLGGNRVDIRSIEDVRRFYSEESSPVN